jgi:putative ABC transport system ATP-binding protein
MPLLEVAGLRKAFVAPDGSPHLVIDVPQFSLAEEMQVGLSGESGLGKTTLLHLIAGILKPDAGTIRLSGTEVSNLPESARDRLRSTHIGYIFQTFNLLPAFSCLENLLVAMSFAGGANRERAKSLLERVGLGSRLHHYPRQLSTGQQQRVAVARALANGPRLILADEPTGNLDHVNAVEVLRLIRETCAENKAALLLVSHDREVLAGFASVVELSQINRAKLPEVTA